MIIPVLAKHMMVAIFKKLPGTAKVRSEGAWEIAKSSLEANGLAKVYSSGQIVLTAKGTKYNMRHAKETDSMAKIKFFDSTILPHIKIGAQEPSANDGK